MLTVSADEVEHALPYGELVEVLRTAFREGAVQPVRHHHTIERPDGVASTLLLMPAWSDFMKTGTSDGGYVGVKIVTVTPDNNARALPAVMGHYLLLDGKTGAPRAFIDGQRLTARRTAAASALAASYLARADASHLLIAGAGALSTQLALAHAAVRPISRISVWNRTLANARKVAAELASLGFETEVAHDLDAAQGDCDIVSCATLSAVPLVKGALLRPGTHIDLVGAFSPTMRESDDALMKRAAVFVDTRAGALKEAGDIVQAVASGALVAEAIAGDLFDLTRGKVKGRTGGDQITVFKSVGAALEDLAAAIRVYEKLAG